jgi:hypothetical protein
MEGADARSKRAANLFFLKNKNVLKVLETLNAQSSLDTNFSHLQRQVNILFQILFINKLFDC